MTTDADQEKMLLNQCLAGSSEAWRNFIKKYSPLVYYVIQKVIRSRCPEGTGEEISDLHNDVFLSFMDKDGRKLRQYEGKNGCSVSTWIRVIAVRATIDYLRKKRDVLSLSDEEPEREAEKKSVSEAGPLEFLEDEEQRQIIKEVIGQLSPKDQLFIRLLYFEEVSPREVARILNSTPNAVYSRGNYLREKLKESVKRKMSKKKI